jgi:hypothetical protein
MKHSFTHMRIRLRLCIQEGRMEYTKHTRTRTCCNTTPTCLWEFIHYAGQNLVVRGSETSDRVESFGSIETKQRTSLIGSLDCIIECICSGGSSLENEWVQESENRFAIGNTLVVEQRDDTREPVKGEIGLERNN